ncbi:hypothetical protein [Halochromatium roseum]|uniref:hypothetical protein n=1 Tax=Halochromatium roseum TaxID=391920 RepID=UPI00191388C3|nr:hypothetical protein [Halochromatium roseum]
MIQITVPQTREKDQTGGPVAIFNLIDQVFEDDINDHYREVLTMPAWYRLWTLCLQQLNQIVSRPRRQRLKPPDLRAHIALIPKPIINIWRGIEGIDKLP